MKIYLSYPMSGAEDLALPRGEYLAAGLRRDFSWHDWVIPHEIPLAEDGTHINPSYSHGDYVRKDIALGLKGCDAIALADGWTQSTGCLAEFQYAMLSGMESYLVIEDIDGRMRLMKLW